MPRVFEEFYQVDASLSKRFDGTGLGLALSRRFIELHGGRMWVESEPGSGSRFSFTLPVAHTTAGVDMRPAGSLPLSAQQEARHGPLLLVAAEDPMVANFLKRHLQNYQIKHVANQDLAGAVAAYLPHAIIQNEPLTHILNGAATHQAVPGDGPLPAGLPMDQTPVISCPLPDTQRVARLLGVDRYLVKPIAREQVLALLADYGERVRHILIVDDDAQLCELLARIVHAAPQAYTIDVACGGQEGLTRMRERRPDLILLDFLMPELNGLSVLHLMRADERLRTIPVVMITAHDLPGEELQWSQPSGIRLEYAHGLRMSELLQCLQALLDSLPPPVPAAAPSPNMATDRP